MSLPGEVAAAGVAIRRISTVDAAALERFYATLSDESRTMRFMGWTTGIGPSGSRAFCTADHDHREGFVAIDGDEVVGHLCLEPDGSGRAEFGIAVADRLQGRGIGRRLLAAGIGWARDAGVRVLTATAFEANSALIRLVQGLEQPVRLREGAAGTMELEVDLAPVLDAAA